jgi:SAM-dependent methyltransferase
MNEGHRTADFFHRYARDFNAIYGNRNTVVNTIVNSVFRRSMRLRYDMTLEHCVPILRRSVLDIGCGPGHYGIELAKRGASEVLGIDFADGMLDIARQAAHDASVQDICSFQRADFFTHDFDRRFDFVIAMGFMDYVAQPADMIRKSLALANVRALFSFPLAGGPLAWQRKLRYRDRCELFLYSREQVVQLFSDVNAKAVEIVSIDRDLFVAASS